ncbi:helix-turn-helix domain-containing protein [Sphingobium yanoikuyae]|uniref:helix-turn-helix domain-containing protein n=1 Tax=Sphingobium yanoikuyae TaxID=13690 RepID=UPI003EFC8F3A
MGRTVYSEPSLKLGAALAEIRREKGVLQEELATRLGKDQSLISNIERGHRRIDVLEFYTIARALDIEPADMFARVTEGFPHKIEV